uniref:Putative ovule protein n=1 Tax=Solanum chacoense TaxID=4108 RepID=A0A0V0HT38_SOLCH
MVEFSDTIEDLELFDFPLEGGAHTWFRGDLNTAASRIDRIIFTSEWSEQFSKVKQIALQRLTSDHVPIALHCGPWGPEQILFQIQILVAKHREIYRQNQFLVEFFCIFRETRLHFSMQIKSLGKEVATLPSI